MVKATYAHAAFKTGDGKDIDLNGQMIRGGNVDTSAYWHAIWSQKTIVQGTWVQYSQAGQTDYDPELMSAPGFVTNNSIANNDEIHFGNIVLNAGAYKVSAVVEKFNTYGILEILHGTTSIGTIDCNGGANNVVVSFVYTPLVLSSGNLRVKVSGSTSAGFRITLSRLEIIRTG